MNLFFVGRCTPIFGFMAAKMLKTQKVKNPPKFLFQSHQILGGGSPSPGLHVRKISALICKKKVSYGFLKFRYYGVLNKIFSKKKFEPIF